MERKEDRTDNKMRIDCRGEPNRSGGSRFTPLGHPDDSRRCQLEPDGRWSGIIYLTLWRSAREPLKVNRAILSLSDADVVAILPARAGGQP